MSRTALAVLTLSIATIVSAQNRVPGAESWDVGGFYILLGTITGAVDSVAVFIDPVTRFRDPATPLFMRMHVGESYQGWVLISVKPREVTLVKDDERIVLELPPLPTPP
jgi:hypothetical protein